MPYATKDIEERLKYIITNEPGGVVFAPRCSGKTTALINTAVSYANTMSDRATIIFPTTTLADIAAELYKEKFPALKNKLDIIFLSRHSAIAKNLLNNPTKPGLLLVDEITIVKPEGTFIAAVGSLPDGKVGNSTYLVGYQSARVPESFHATKYKYEQPVYVPGGCAKPTES